jgi:hypothetical protein
MDCGLRTSRLKTIDGRTVCGRAGVLYNVTGALASLTLVCCTRHARQLRRIGLLVDKVTPLEQLAAKANSHKPRKAKSR